MQAHEEHNEALMKAFAALLKAEEAEAKAKTEIERQTTKLKSDIRAAEIAQADAWREIAELMAETGEVEVTLPGNVTDYKIGWQAGRKSVKANAEATPDEWCKIERKPKLKEIGAYLDNLEASGQALPNWASTEVGEPKLVWRAVKKFVSMKGE